MHKLGVGSPGRAREPQFPYTSAPTAQPADIANCSSRARLGVAVLLRKGEELAKQRIREKVGGPE